MKLKIFALLLSLFVILAAFASCGGTTTSEESDTDSAEATDSATENIVTDPVVEGGKLAVSAEVIGNQLMATVSLTENPGVAAFNIQLHYDNTKLFPVEITDSELVDPYVISSNIQQSEDIVSELAFATVYYANPTDFTADGVLFTMLFNILDGASGETELTLVAKDEGVVNQKIEEVILTLEGCTVNLG